jgi:hypothetical protein
VFDVWERHPQLGVTDVLILYALIAYRRQTGHVLNPYSLENNNHENPFPFLRNRVGSHTTIRRAVGNLEKHGLLRFERSGFGGQGEWILSVD